MSAGEGEVAAAWDSEAEAWIRWARSPRLDHAFWRLNLPATLELLPPPEGTTVDVGCAEGRLARELARRGYEVVAIDGSPAMVAAARVAAPELDIRLGDASDLPLDDGSAALAVASMALMNFEDHAGAVAEIARVLGPGGRFCFSILHPLNSWRDAGAGDHAARPYFEPARYREEVSEGGEAVVLNDIHRPLSAYFDALTRAGFAVEALREPRPDPTYAAEFAAAARWRERPGFLHVRAVLLAEVRQTP
jgi:SAM-dependent methyltransferase